MDIAFLKALVKLTNDDQPYCVLKTNSKVLLCTKLKKRYNTLSQVPHNEFVTGWQDFDNQSGIWCSWNKIREVELFEPTTRTFLQSIKTDTWNWKSSATKSEFIDTIEYMQKQMKNGEYFLANLTRNIDLDEAADPYYAATLSTLIHETPYRFFHSEKDLAFLGLSPERFIEIKGNHVLCEPMKGTAKVAGELYGNLKEFNENTMMIDLMRSELSKICLPATIRVEERDTLTSHPGLVQLSSKITGELDNFKVSEAVEKILPVASVTGTPKPKVIQEIPKLEKQPRGQYCGTYGWINNLENSCDLAVSIRSVIFKNSKPSIGVGAGITLESNPIEEFEETELKASRLKTLAEASIQKPVQGIFTSCSISKSGEVFRINAHLKRLKNDCSEIDIKLDTELLIKQISQVLEKEDSLSEKYLKISITKNSQEISLREKPEIKPVISLGISPFLTPNPKLGVKSINRKQYEQAFDLGKECANVDVDDVLLVANGNIYETTRANIFLLINGKLTTSLDSNDLICGTARECLLEYLDKNNIECIKSPINMDTLKQASEIITINAVRGPQIVSKISSLLLDDDIHYDANSDYLFEIANKAYTSGFEKLP